MLSITRAYKCDGCERSSYPAQLERTARNVICRDLEEDATLLHLMVKGGSLQMSGRQVVNAEDWMLYSVRVRGDLHADHGFCCQVDRCDVWKRKPLRPITQLVQSGGVMRINLISQSATVNLRLLSHTSYSAKGFKYDRVECANRTIKYAAAITPFDSSLPSRMSKQWTGLVHARC